MSADAERGIQPDHPRSFFFEAVDLAMSQALQRLADEGRSVIVHRDGQNLEVPASELIDSTKGD